MRAAPARFGCAAAGGSRAGAERAMARTASRSHERATASAKASIDCTMRLRSSTTGTSPRWRSRHSNLSSLRSTPTTGMPTGASASRSITSCPSLPTRLSITPATRTPGSNVAKPWTTAATEPLMAEASTTSTTGAPRSLATWAVLAVAPSSAAPSNRPITPSTTRMSAPSAALAATGAMASSPQIQASRFRDGRPTASAW